jgi:alkylhydroperoxidase family enzyme
MSAGQPPEGARIELLGPDEAQARAAVAGLPPGLAELNVFRGLLQHPVYARWISDLLMGLLAAEHLDARLRELVIMRIGWVTGSEYEWAQHWRIAQVLGVSPADLAAVRRWREHAGFGPAERAVLAATDEVLQNGTVSDATWNACTEDLSSDPRILVELIGAIGAWQMISVLLRTLAVPLEDPSSPWPPDGTLPSPRGAAGRGLG